jgi:hypothetical protein
MTQEYEQNCNLNRRMEQSSLYLSWNPIRSPSDSQADEAIERDRAVAEELQKQQLSERPSTAPARPQSAAAPPLDPKPARPWTPQPGTSESERGMQMTVRLGCELSPCSDFMSLFSEIPIAVNMLTPPPPPVDNAGYQAFRGSETPLAKRGFIRGGLSKSYRFDLTSSSRCIY